MNSINLSLERGKEGKRKDFIYIFKLSFFKYTGEFHRMSILMK